MKLQVGNMWDAFDEADLFLFTANSTLNSRVELVMGRGMARQVKDKFSWVPHDIGVEVVKRCGALGAYYIIYFNQGYIPQNIGAFQVKYHYKDKASMPLIVASTAELRGLCQKNPGINVHLNYPGIGNGGLTIEQVEPIIATLPDNVTVWRYE